LTIAKSKRTEKKQSPQLSSVKFFVSKLQCHTTKPTLRHCENLAVIDAHNFNWLTRIYNAKFKKLKG
jgi:hypothetical protein